MIVPVKIFLSSFLIFFTSFSWAYTVDTLPNQTDRGSYFSNPDGVLNNEDEKMITQRLQQIKSSYSNQVAIVVINTISEQVPKDFALDFLKNGGLARKAKIMDCLFY
jgi:uncharacterized protein